MLHFESVLWEHDGNASWHFVTVPDDVSEEIQDQSAPLPPEGIRLGPRTRHGRLVDVGHVGVPGERDALRVAGQEAGPAEGRT